MKAGIMKVLFIIGDGMADRPLKELDDRTPLEKATTPNMDYVAKNSICGLVDPIAPGIRPGSAPAHLALLGYDPYVYYTGRGPFEAMGNKMKVKTGDVAFRCNFGTVNKRMVVLDRRAGRDLEGLDKLSKALDGMKLKTAPDIKVFFKKATAHRAVLMLRGPEISPKVSDVDSGRTNVKPLVAKPLDGSLEAKVTAKAVNEFVSRAHQIMEKHFVNKKRVKAGKLPANIVLVRGAGVAPKMEAFKDKYGIKFSACVAETTLVKGVASYAGMRIIDVPGATAGLDTDTRAIGMAAVKALSTSEFVLVNVKGTDVAAHDGNFKAKIEMIEKIDEMLGDIWGKISREETYVLITADHTTPISVKDHTADPVPIAISGPMVRVDDVIAFNERVVAKGGLGRIRGLDIMPILMDLLGKAKKFGA